MSHHVRLWLVGRFVGRFVIISYKGREVLDKQHNFCEHPEQRLKDCVYSLNYTEYITADDFRIKLARQLNISIEFWQGVPSISLSLTLPISTTLHS